MNWANLLTTPTNVFSQAEIQQMQPHNMLEIPSVRSESSMFDLLIVWCILEIQTTSFNSQVNAATEQFFTNSLGSHYGKDTGPPTTGFQVSHTNASSFSPQKTSPFSTSHGCKEVPLPQNGKSPAGGTCQVWWKKSIRQWPSFVRTVVAATLTFPTYSADTHQPFLPPRLQFSRCLGAGPELLWALPFLQIVQSPDQPSPLWTGLPLHFSSTLTPFPLFLLEDMEKYLPFLAPETPPLSSLGWGWGALYGKEAESLFSTLCIVVIRTVQECGCGLGKEERATNHFGRRDPFIRLD